MGEEIEFKQKFVERFSQLTDFEEFRRVSLSFPSRAIRVNTLKASVEYVQRRLSQDWILTPVPWCSEGFWIEHRGEPDGHKRRDVGNLREHALGYIYIQDPASMMPPVVLAPQPGEMVLDMCASPGSKASQLLAMLNGEGYLVANDYKGDRLAPLGLNLQRVGATNLLVSLTEGKNFTRYNLGFDKVLVDAPCSGTGTIRKSLKTLRIWNPNMIRRLAGTQKQLVKTAFEKLVPGGSLVYSTCSVEPEENEGVISELLQQYGNAEMVPIELPLKRSPPITEFADTQYDSRVSECLRVWPQDNDTEGFFVACVKKKES